MAGNEEEETLNRLFGQAAALVWSVSDGWSGLEYLALREDCALPTRAATSGSAAAEASVRATEAVRSASSMARDVNVISANDTLEDLPTRSLRFILLPYLSALANEAWQGDTSGRLLHLETARSEVVDFFHQVDGLHLLSQTDRDRVLENTPDLIQTPQQKRDMLIARHRAQKESAKKLEALLEHRRRVGLHSNEEGDHEEIERTGMLDILQAAVQRAMDMQASIDRELEVLRYAVAAEARGINPSEKAAREKPRGPPPGMNGLPGTFRIVDKREEARKGVFRPDHSIPTYTVEEWGRIEMQRAIEAERRQKEAGIVKAKAAAEEDSDGEEATDRATYEARRWDDWKDEHNKGSGNTLR